MGLLNLSGGPLCDVCFEGNCTDSLHANPEDVQLNDFRKLLEPLHSHTPLLHTEPSTHVVNNPTDDVIGNPAMDDVGEIDNVAAGNL